MKELKFETVQYIHHFTEVAYRGIIDNWSDDMAGRTIMIRKPNGIAIGEIIDNHAYDELYSIENGDKYICGVDYYHKCDGCDYGLFYHIDYITSAYVLNKDELRILMI